LPERPSESEDPDYHKHGGFPEYEIAEPPPGFARFLSAMRRLQDLAVSANPSENNWESAADGVEGLVDLLAPAESPEGVPPAGRSPKLPGMGSLLMPPWMLTRYEPECVELRGQFSRYHVGGNMAVHGGVLPMVFDWLFGMIIHAANRPISRTAFLHVDYRNVTPINAPLIVRGRVDSIDGRKAFVSGKLTAEDGLLLAEGTGLMVQLLPGQP
jgi:acyl-coenzyme A thioesterase PaaI-like protein